jgi:hypothetical protein
MLTARASVSIGESVVREVMSYVRTRRVYFRGWREHLPICWNTYLCSFSEIDWRESKLKERGGRYAHLNKHVEQ